MFHIKNERGGTAAQRQNNEMPSKRALVVDDSKSARLILRKMLERLGLGVDLAESAEQSLEYLKDHRPDVIFMDHMMPGMDGLQAVREIKAEPRTASIPVLMYTSKQGDVYVGQARALGAVGVIPKEVKPADLERTLEQLHLLPDPEPKPEPKAEPKPVAAAGDAAARSGSAHIAALARDAAEAAVRASLHSQLEAQRKQLRAEMTDELEPLLRRLLAEAREVEPPRRRRWPAVAAALVVLAMAPVAGYFARDVAEAYGWPASTAPVAAAPAPVADTGETDKLRRTLAIAHARSQNERVTLLQTLEWAVNNSGEYGYGELAFGDRRLLMLTELVSRLNAARFEGTIELQAHIGDFCLVRDERGDLKLAPPELPLERCDLVGFDRNQARSLAEQQSVGFANFLATSPLLREGKIKVRTQPVGNSRPLFGYPPRANVATAGLWNAIAARNNRIQIKLIPSP